MSLEAKLIDKRVVRRNLESGLLERALFDTYIERLPDCASKCSVPTSAPAPASDANVTGADDARTAAVAP